MNLTDHERWNEEMARKYNPDATGAPDLHVWPLRNYLWSKSGPKFAHDIEEIISVPEVRYKMVDNFCAIWRFKLENLIRSENTIATDQIIRYPVVSDDSRYTFSLFAFPEEQYPVVLPEFFEWVKDYYKREGYRTNVLFVGYRIAQDQKSLLSYSYDGPVMTIDPVSTANPGWKTFLGAYNQFCGDRGGLPLFNQTFGVTAELARKAFGDRLIALEAARKSFDPGDRMLNDYFKSVMT